jgi:O-antigen ligase/Flp pilus assembly protein TadD
MMFVLPAVGVPNELMLQDTLKSAIAAFGILGTALLFFWQQRHRTEPLLWHGMVWLPVVLMLYALGSMVWSHTYLAGVEAIRWFLLSLLMWLGLNTFTQKNLPLLLWGIHAGAVVASLWVVLQFWFDLQLFPQAAPPSSTFINRNFFAEYAVTVLPFSVYFLANVRASRWLPMVAFSVALNVVALMMTGTRSALVALLLLVPVLTVILVRYRQQFALTHWRHGNQAVVGLILVLGVWAMGSVPSGNTTILHEGAGDTALQRSFHRAASMTERQEYTERSFSIRSQMWMATARMMIANPWTGVGAGAWEVQIPLYQRNDTTLETDYYAHNEWLQLLSEYGLVVGGLVLAFLLAYLLQAAGTTWRLRGKDVEEAPLRAFTLASLLALLIVSNAGFPWHLAGCGALLVLCMAMMAGSDARLRQEERFFAKRLYWQPVYSRMALALLVGCMVLATYTTWQAAQAERKLVQAINIAESLRRPQQANASALSERHAQLLKTVRKGIAINPHYRKLTAMVADQLSAMGDSENAAWIWQSILDSRPNVSALWTNLALTYSELGRHEQAHLAWLQVQRLKPEAMATRTLELNLMSRSGHYQEAARLLNDYFDQQQFDYDRIRAALVIAYRTRDWPLAIRALELRNQTWPEFAMDGYLKLGLIYAEPDMDMPDKARAAFKAGLDITPVAERANYVRLIPEKYRSQM